MRRAGLIFGSGIGLNGVRNYIILMANRRDSSASTGGQWNFSGVLYQLLASLKAGLTATIEEVVAGRDGASVRIIVEPADGGDAQTVQPEGRRVDQIKIRRGSAPWTSRTIVEEVLPDLFKAAGGAGQPTLFRFITDNLDGTEAFSQFVETIREAHRASKGPAELDTLERPFRWGAERISAEGLFTRIVETLDAPEEAVWRFLGAVEVAGWSEAAITGEVDAMLADLVDEREEIPVKRKALVAHLLGVGKVGTSLSASGLLQAVDLNPSRLTLARRLPGLLRTHVQDALDAAKYDRSMDVRGASASPAVPLSVLSGDSGQGKTWRMCRAAQEMVEAGRCAMLIPAKGGLADIEAKVVDAIWRTDFDRSLPIARIAERLRPQLSDEEGVWLTLFLDDLADPSLAAELSATPWARLGIRVVISAQNRMTRLLRQATEGLGEVAVPDFTLAEVRDYLRRAGRDPKLLPDDVLLSLTRPVLAAIYCRIPGSEHWAAVSEYELVDLYWRWATTESRSQALHASDGYAVLRLAGTLLDGNAIYPWQPSVTARLDVQEAVRDRLITVGVLREDETGALQVAHDRVLNWAVAGEIERRFLEGELTFEGVTGLLDRLDKITTQRGEPIGRRLGYVLSDVFWKLARNAKPEEVGALALQAIRAGVASREHEHFFTEGLGSLGQAIIPGLVWMARQPFSEEEWLLPRYLAKAFVAVAESASEEVASAAVELVDDIDPQIRSIGLNVLGKVAAPQALDLLWSINRERNAAMIAARGDSDRWSEQRMAKEQSFDALARAVRTAPQWLRAKARETVDAEDADQLIWLLLQVDERTGRAIWAASKHNLLSRVSPASIAVPRAIRYFRDHDELGRIDAALNDPEPYSAALWFDALASLAPERALERLDQLSSRELWGTSHWWLWGMVRRIGSRVHERLVETVGHEQEDGEQTLRELAILYRGEQDLLDAATFDLLIDSFEAIMEREAQGATVQPGAHHHLRSLVASAASPILLERLAARKGSRFEYLLARHAISRTGRSSMWRDSDGDDYHFILAAVAGDGYDQFVLAELDRSNSHARTDGVSAAAWTFNADVRARLEAIANDPEDDTYRQVQLMHALASHRADAGLRAMVRGGSPVFLRAAEVRENGPPWSGEDLAEVERLVQSSDPSERTYGINLCGFLGEETATSILAPLFDDPALSDEEADLIRGVLSHLGGYRPSFLPRLRKRLGNEDQGGSTAHYLAWSGDAKAREAVVEWLAADPLKQLSSSVVPIAFQLLRHQDSAAGARAYLKRVWKKGFGWGSEGQILSALADAGDNEASAALDAIAYQKPRRGDGSVVAAVRALAKVSRDEAFAAAERFYRRSRTESAVYLLLELNPGDGADVLLGDYAGAPVPVRHRIGRLLRRAAPRSQLVETLSRMGASEDGGDRQTAAELAGWMPFEEPVSFLEGLVDDESEAVEKAALIALRQRQADAESAALISSVAAQPRPRQWAWLHALIRRGDPAHLADSKDPRSIHALLGKLGDEFREEANSLLKKRSKELEERAEKLEKDRRN